MDLAGSNELSISPRSAATRSTFWYKADGETIGVTAPEGKTHLVVHMRVTHRGNFDGVNYTIETPPLSAFTLYGEGGAFMPLQIPANASPRSGGLQAEDAR